MPHNLQWRKAYSKLSKCCLIFFTVIMKPLCLSYDLYTPFLHSFKSQQYAGCLSHEYSLVTLAPSSLRQLSDRAFWTNDRNVIGSSCVGSTRIFFSKPPAYDSHLFFSCVGNFPTMIQYIVVHFQREPKVNCFVI